MVLPDPDFESASGTGAERSVTVVVPFADERPQPGRCGMQKNGYNMDTADALCDRDPAEWIASLLVKQLSAAGFRVAKAGDDAPPGLRIEGHLLQLFIEPVIGAWTGSLEADLHIRLKVTRASSGLAAQRNFYVKGIRAGQLLSLRGAYQIALRRATKEAVKEMVAAIAEFLDAYPEAQTDE